MLTKSTLLTNQCACTSKYRIEGTQTITIWFICVSPPPKKTRIHSKGTNENKTRETTTINDIYLSQSVAFVVSLCHFKYLTNAYNSLNECVCVHFDCSPVQFNLHLHGFVTFSTALAMLLTSNLSGAPFFLLAFPVWHKEHQTLWTTNVA